MRFKHVVNLILNIVSTCLIIGSLANLDYAGMNRYVLLTFIINGLFCLAGSMFSKQFIDVHRMVYIFGLFFFFIAPLMQYSSGEVFWTNWGLNVSYSSNDYLLANISIFAFLCFFEVSYRLSIRTIHKTSDGNLKPFVISETARTTLIVVCFLCVITVLLNGQLFGFQDPAQTQKFFGQILLAMRYVPVASLLFYIFARQKGIISGKSTSFLITLIFFNSLLFFPFSGSTTRFVLFGVYISIWTALEVRSKLKSIVLLAFVLGFMYVFSAFNVFKGGTFADFHLVSSEAFLTVDFDAYQMLMATMKYVKEFGTTHGMNVISALLCFVPRSIFSFRLEPTSEIVVKALGSKFYNVSLPLNAEMMVAFGYSGLVGLSIILGNIVRRIDSFAHSSKAFQRVFFCTISGLTIFIMRGSFLAACSYTFALLSAVAGVYGIITLLSKYRSQSR